MATMPLEKEQVLAMAVRCGNRINRMFGASAFDTLIAGASSFDDLISDLYANLLTGTISKFPKEVKITLQHLEQGLKYLHLIGKLTDSQVTSATDWDTASADTSLRYLFTQWITLNGFSATDEGDIDAVFSQAVTA